MIHEEMRELQEYLTPPPTPLFKREVSLIVDKETRKKHEDEFVNQIIKTCEEYSIKDAFTLITIFGILEKNWRGHMIVESKDKDGNGE